MKGLLHVIILLSVVSFLLPTNFALGLLTVHKHSHYTCKDCGKLFWHQCDKLGSPLGPICRFPEPDACICISPLGNYSVVVEDLLAE